MEKGLAIDDKFLFFRKTSFENHTLQLKKILSIALKCIVRVAFYTLIIAVFYRLFNILYLLAKYEPGSFYISEQLFTALNGDSYFFCNYL